MQKTLYAYDFAETCLNQSIMCYFELPLRDISLTAICYLLLGIA